MEDMTAGQWHSRICTPVNAMEHHHAAPSQTEGALSYQTSSNNCAPNITPPRTTSYQAQRCWNIMTPQTMAKEHIAIGSMGS